MKLTKLSLLAALGTFSFLSSAWADIVVHTPNAGKEDICKQITGDWSGKGKATVISVINCIYNGKGSIESSETGEVHINKLDLYLVSKESSIICPPKETLHLTGSCHNGKIIIHDDASKLDGELSEEGKKAHITGTVTFTLPVIGKLTPDVVMDLVKK